MVCGVFWLVPGGGSCESRDAIQGCRATIQEMQAKWGAHFMLRPTILLLFFLQGGSSSLYCPTCTLLFFLQGGLSLLYCPTCMLLFFLQGGLSLLYCPTCMLLFFLQGGSSSLCCPTCMLLFFLQGGSSSLYCPTCTLLFFLQGDFLSCAAPPACFFSSCGGTSPNFCPNATYFRQQKTILHPTKPIKCAHWMQYRLLSRRMNSIYCAVALEFEAFSIITAITSLIVTKSLYSSYPKSAYNASRFS